MSDTELLACPFCGGGEITLEPDGSCYSCQTCCTEGPYTSTAPREGWNTRADSIANHPDVVRLIEAAKYFIEEANNAACDEEADMRVFVHARSVLEVRLSDLQQLTGVSTDG